MHISIHTYSLHVYVDEHNTNEWKSCVRIDNMSYVAPSLKQDWLTQAHLGRWCINYQSIYSIYLFNLSIHHHPSIDLSFNRHLSIHPSIPSIHYFVSILFMHPSGLTASTGVLTNNHDIISMSCFTDTKVSIWSTHLSIHLSIHLSSPVSWLILFC